MTLCGAKLMRDVRIESKQKNIPTDMKYKLNAYEFLFATN